MAKNTKMNTTLDYFTKKLEIDLRLPSPIVLKYSRYHIIELFRELNFKVGLEIGTEHGIYAQKICVGNPQLKLFCVDSWLADTYYHHNTEQDMMDELYDESKQRLSLYNCEILKMTSMEAVKQFEPNSLDFVFIDGNHNREYVREDIRKWAPIVRPGGILYGHDYREEVEEEVNLFANEAKINPWFVLHRGGYMIPCWMFIRDEHDLIH